MAAMDGPPPSPWICSTCFSSPSSRRAMMIDAPSAIRDGMAGALNSFRHLDVQSSSIFS